MLDSGRGKPETFKGHYQKKQKTNKQKRTCVDENMEKLEPLGTIGRSVK